MDEYKYNPLAHTVEKIQVQRGKVIDDAILGEIQQIATENGIVTNIVVNERAIVHALVNAIPGKPHPMQMDGLIFGYNCPSCIMAVSRDAKYCSNCGRKLDWSDSE